MFGIVKVITVIIVNGGILIRKLGEVLCCLFLFAILGVDPAQNLAKYKRFLRVLLQLTNRNIVFM